MTQNDEKYIIAIELSGTSVRGAAARVGAKGSVPEIIAAETADNAACVQYGRVQNLIEAANHTSYVIKKLENNPALRQGKITSVYVALAGRTLSTVKTTAEISLPTEMEMTEELLRRLYRDATRTIAPDRSVLKVMPRKFIVDSHPVTNPVGAMGSKFKGEFTVVVCSPVNRRNLELVMDERLNMPVAGYIVTPLAEAAMVLTEEEKQLGCVMVDFGAHTTTISIYKDRSLQYIATLPLGSKNITRDLAAGLSLTDERAELTKCTLGAAVTKPNSSAEANRVNGYVQARLGEILANIVAQIGFAGFKLSDLAGGMVILGGAVKMKFFAQFVEQQTKIKVRQASAGASLNLALGITATAELLPLFSIVNMAAARADMVSCIELPATEVEDIADDEPDTASADEDDNYDDADDDENWDRDDDEVERRRIEQRQRTQERRRTLVRDEEQRRRRNEEERLREQRKIKGDASLDTPDDEPQSSAEHKESLLERIKNSVTNIFKSAPIDDDDADLDDEQ